MKTGREYILKILSGPHLGAEVILNQDRYTLGQDETCEIILNDMDIAKEHLTLSVAEDCLNLTALGGSFLVNGEKTGPTDARVDFFQVVTIGTTRFAVGPGDEKWPALSATDTVYKSDTQETADIPPASEDTQESDREEQPDKFLTKQRKKLLLVACCLCMAVITVSISFILKSNAASDAGSETGMVRSSNLDKTNSIINEMGFGHIHAALKDHGHIVVKGYVKDQAAKNKLIDHLSLQNLDVEVRVWVSKTIMEGCREVLRASGFSFKVASLEPGDLIFTGTDKDRQDWEKAKTLLQQDVPGIRSMAFRIMKSPLPGSVVQDKVTTKNHIQTGKPGRRSPGFRLAVRSVNLGRIRYLTWENGHKYFEGSELENGYVIKSIHPDRIILSRAERDKTYYFGVNK